MELMMEHDELVGALSTFGERLTKLESSVEILKGHIESEHGNVGHALKEIRDGITSLSFVIKDDPAHSMLVRIALLELDRKVSERDRDQRVWKDRLVISASITALLGLIVTVVGLILLKGITP